VSTCESKIYARNKKLKIKSLCLIRYANWDVRNIYIRACLLYLRRSGILIELNVNGTRGSTRLKIFGRRLLGRRGERRVRITRGSRSVAETDEGLKTPAALGRRVRATDTKNVIVTTKNNCRSRKNPFYIVIRTERWRCTLLKFGANVPCFTGDRCQTRREYFKTKKKTSILNNAIIAETISAA